MSLENEDLHESDSHGSDDPSQESQSDHSPEQVEQETEPAFTPPDALSAEAIEIRASIQKIRDEIGKVIIGQTELIDLMVAAMITNGHVLLEGVPGIAKTLISKLLARCISADFSRIQFTPDLMPTDIVGTTYGGNAGRTGYHGW